MMFRDIAELINVIQIPDGVGGFTETTTSRTVFCDKKSIRSSEFYDAHAHGLKPEIALTVRTVDYNEEPRVLFSAIEYNVLRTYSKNGEFVDLVCEKRAEAI